MKYIRAIWRVLLLLFYWRRNHAQQIELETQPTPAPNPTPTPQAEEKTEAEPAETPTPEPAPETTADPGTTAAPVEYADWHRKGKFVKPKGEKPEPKPRSSPPKSHNAPQPKPKLLPPRPEDDPEQWGQYYFRDAILDQLDRYWIYLRRMKHGDEDSYMLLRQVGIQLLPYSATRGFDKFRDEYPALSPWWHSNRPGFGAVGYGLDDVTQEAEKMTIADIADPNYAAKHQDWYDRHDKILGDGLQHRPLYLIKPKMKYDHKQFSALRVVWTPRFLYFSKYKKPPLEFEQVSGDGDFYKMTVYWDRVGKYPRKRYHRGGVPQDYGIWLERGTGNIRLVKCKIQETITMKFCHGPNGGKAEDLHFVQTQWTIPDKHLRWCHCGPGHVEPTEYLRRMFIQAATMVESAQLGSMIRVAVTKNRLTAAFGVEVKRTSYFFKDRDIVLNVNGRKKPIFHIVRPHVRANGKSVPMHFRGLRKFTWAGYEVSISVPGRDHMHLTDYDLGGVQGPIKKGFVGTDHIGKMLAGMIKDHKGGTHGAKGK